MKRIWNKTSGWRLPAIAVVSATFALVSVLTRAEPLAKTPVVTPPKSQFTRQVAGIGVIEPKSELISVGTELPGVVRTVAVKAGDVVKAGQLLFTLDERDIEAQIGVLKASLASAEIQAKDAQLQFQLVDSVKDDRAVARDEVNRKKFAAELAKARVAEIRSQLALATTTKSRLSVRAPVDGSILDVNVRPGEYVATGGTAEPAVRMGDVSTFHVRVEFDEENAALLSPKSPAVAMKRGAPGKTYELQFVRTEPFVAPKQNLAVVGQRVDTRVLQVIYALPADLTAVFTGQQMDVFIDIGQGGV